MHRMTEKQGKKNPKDRKEDNSLELKQSLQCIYEAIHWNNQEIQKMDLADKDIFLVVGPSRAGKGTLLAAL